MQNTETTASMHVLCIQDTPASYAFVYTFDFGGLNLIAEIESDPDAILGFA